jgi:cold shock CspA family protein
MQASRRGAVRALLLALVFAATGCAATEALAGAGNGEVSGEVRRVDERSRTIEVGSWYGGARNVRYDSRTRAVADGRDLPVRALERGDRVSMSVYRGRDGALYTDRIYLERSARGYPRTEPTRGGGVRAYTYEGRVAKIDSRKGSFELQPSRGQKVKVSLPSRPGSALERDFRRLRNGQYVRVQAEPLRGNQVRAVRIY